MFRKVTSVFILLAFMLVKGTSLWISEQEKPLLGYCISDQESEEMPKSDKSDKWLEFCDDDFLPNYAFELVSFENVQRVNHDAVLQVLPIYISSVNPPPDSSIFPG